MKIPHDPVVARADHHRAVVEFIATARAVPENRWEIKPDDSHWSPAQIVEHVRLSYEVVGGQFNGGRGLVVRTPWWLRTLLRWKFLSGILERGVFPKGARAPREIRPGDGPFDRNTVLSTLLRAATETEERLVAHWGDPDAVMTHHVFGALTSAQGARLLMVHTAHHAKQLRALSESES